MIRVFREKISRLDLSELIYSKLFWFGILLKLVLGAFLVSDYMVILFAPFIDFFSNNPSENPYKYFYDKGTNDNFPYPAFMLYAMSLPHFVLNWREGLDVTNLWVYRLPLLFFDLAILLVLWRWMKGATSRRNLLIYYWLSPVLIYITYIHGQLDVIPMSLTFITLYFLFREKLSLAPIFLGLAISSKLHIVLIVPFIISYLVVQRTSKIKILKASSICLLVILVVNAPFLASVEFYKLTFSSNEQSKVFGVLLTYLNNSDVEFYVVPCAYALLFANSLVRQSFNRDILIMYLGFAFGILLFFIPPQQGWYFWILPYFSYFYSKEKRHALPLFLGLQFLYILYFGIKEDSDYIEVFQLVAPIPDWSLNMYLDRKGVNVQEVESLIFTFLQTLLLINCIWMYTRGIASYQKHGFTSKPYMVGIGGDSGVGKTTLSENIRQVFKLSNTTVIRGDDMHKWERGHEMWEEYTHLNPKANYLHKEYDYLKILKEGKSAFRRHYDHTNGRFTEEKGTVVKKLVIFEGLHTFYLDKMRSIYDLKIFIRPDTQLATHWKIIRDRKKRGYTTKQVLEKIRKREDDRVKYIEPQEKYADVLIELLCEKKIENLGDETEVPEIYLRMRYKNSVYLDELVERLGVIPGLNIQHYYDHNENQFIVFRGDIPDHKLESIAHNALPDFDEIGVYNPNWPPGFQGIVLLFLSYYIFDDEANRNA